MFDYVVVDTPAQFSEHVLTAMDVSAHHVLLTTPDVPALKNLRVTLDMLDLLSYPREIRSIVLNRSDSKVGLSPERRGAGGARARSPRISRPAAPCPSRSTRARRSRWPTRSTR